MTAHLLLAGKPRRVALFRALQLGDMMCAVPALRALRRALPGAEITLIGLPWARAFAARFSRYVDRFIVFPGHPALPEQEPAPTAAVFAAAMRAEAFDVVIQAHGNGSTTNALVASWRPGAWAGFRPRGTPAPAHAATLEWPDHGHESERLVRLLASLGAPSDDLSLEFPLTTSDRAEHDAVPALRALAPGRYVCIHPGSRMPSRRWPAGRFAEVVRALHALGFTAVVTGSEVEQPLAKDVIRQAAVPAVLAAGETSLGALAYLISRAALLVSNDTGVSHLAAALQVPSVVIACGSEVGRWAPLDHERHHVLWQPIACRPCAFTRCPVPGHPCATAVRAENVLEAAKGLLAVDGRSARGGAGRRLLPEPLAGLPQPLLQ